MTAAFELQLDPLLCLVDSADQPHVRFWLPKWSEQQQCHFSSNAPSATPARTSFACEPASPHSNASSQHPSNRHPRSNQHHLSNSVGVAATPLPRRWPLAEWHFRRSRALRLRSHIITRTPARNGGVGSRDTWRLKTLMRDADADIITSKCSQDELSASSLD